MLSLDLACTLFYVVKTKKVETRKDIVVIAWHATIAHLKEALGPSPNDWGWGHAHNHPLRSPWPFGWLFNVGQFEMPGGREVPNNQTMPIGPAPWAVQ